LWLGALDRQLPNRRSVRKLMQNPTQPAKKVVMMRDVTSDTRGTNISFVVS
jgi:hypothetical protein